MKILYHHRIASKDGQYVHVEELTNALIEKGEAITFVAPGFAQESDFGSEGGIASKLKSLLPKWLYEMLELSYCLLIAVKLIKAILKERPDFIYERYNLYQPAGVIVAKLFKLPILMEVNAPLADERSKYSGGLGMPWLAHMIEAFTWRHSSAVLPVTEVLANIVLQKGVAYSRVHVIHNGINNNFFKELPDTIITESDRTIVVGFVGFIHRWHGMDLAIEAVARCENQDVELVCVGDGDIRGELEELAKKLGIDDRVTFTGLKNRSEVFDYVKKFDISLQPAVTPYASPLKLFEYMAVGSLIVAPDSENILEIVNGKSALLFKNEDKQDFQEKLKTAIQGIHNLVDKRIEAKRLIIDKRFTWQDNAERVCAIAIQCIEEQA